MAKEVKKKKLKRYTLTIDSRVKKFKSAPLSRRFGSYLLDLLIFYFIFFQPFVAITGYFSGITTESIVYCSDNHGKSYCIPVINFATSVVISSLFIFLLYLVLLEKFVGFTLGEKILRLKIVGNRDFTRIFLRNITKSILVVLLPLDLISMFFTKDRQRYTEVLSGTKVIYEQSMYDIAQELIK